MLSYIEIIIKIKMSKLPYDTKTIEKILNTLEVTNLKNDFKQNFNTGYMTLYGNSENDLFEKYIEEERNNLKNDEFKIYFLYKEMDGRPEIYILSKENTLSINNQCYTFLDKNNNEVYSYFPIYNDNSESVTINNLIYKKYKENTKLQIKLNEENSIELNSNNNKKFRIIKKGNKSIISLEKTENGFLCEFKNSLYKSIELDIEGKIIGMCFTESSKNKLNLTSIKGSINKYEDLMESIKDNIQFSLLISDKCKIKTSKKDFEKNLLEINYFIKNSDSLLELLNKNNEICQTINFEPKYHIKTSEMYENSENFLSISEEVSRKIKLDIFEKLSKNKDPNYFYLNGDFIRSALMLAIREKEAINPIDKNIIDKVLNITDELSKNLKKYNKEKVTQKIENNW